MTTAIVNFRTLAAGSYRYLRRGQRRGYWRVLIVKDPAGCTSVNSHNVVSVRWEGRPGILGVTERSNYYLGFDKTRADDIANTINGSRA